ncbi:MAG: 1-acyl-sn-glycerol-3-phosphate acyltransferase [Bacteroidales bacterium]|jgi:1-acyl-sn-glycerol-3-phosphate acyltransferase|nr:1-acyl-sn-glycerol-3-phosphate acyltransferase [Bacteroidales bacterium]
MDILKSAIVWLAGVFFIVVLFPLTFIIWLISLPFDSNRLITHWVLMWQSFLLVKLMPIWKVSITGREKAQKGQTYVIISNHQSILDILLINCLRYNYKWISKIENTKVPVLGWYLRMAGYITVDRGNKESKEKMLEKSSDCLKKNISVMIFPEGTRSPDREIGFFKRGAFQLAISENIPILPVVLDGSGGVLPKHGLVFSTGHKIRMEVFDPVYPESFGTDDPDILSVKFSTFMKETLKNWRAVKS